MCIRDRYNCTVNDVRSAVRELRTGERTDEYRTADFKMRPEQIAEAFSREPVPDAVFLVSPTYEGRIADIETIAKQMCIRDSLEIALGLASC